jgi:hypothetical protein
MHNANESMSESTENYFSSLLLILNTQHAEFLNNFLQGKI